MRRQGVVTLTVGVAVYMLAYWHGRVSHSSAGCPACATGATELAALNEALRLQTLTPHTERVMVDCILERPDMRQALRERLHLCIAGGGSVSIPPPPAARPTNALADTLSTAGANQWRTGQESPSGVSSPPPVSASTAAATSGLVADQPSLEVELATSRQNEAALVSSPEIPTNADSIPPEVAKALAAAPGGGLLLIVCASNGRYFAPETPDPEFPPTSPWLACSGDPDAPTPIFDGLFSRELLVGGRTAYRHLMSGLLMQVVPAGEEPSWVVRLHARVAGEREAFEERSQDAVTYLYNPQCGCHPNLRFGTVLRGHGAVGGSAAGAIEVARMELRPYDERSLREWESARLSKAAAARSHTVKQMATIATLAASNEVRVISYGLYGASSRYTIGVIRNAELAPLVYPGWKVRVYHDASVPTAVISKLRELNAELIDMQRRSGMRGGIGGMFWRFLVAADKSVDRFIVRDSDSRLNPRERLAVEAWIQSGAKIHSLRDHPNHDRPLNGGMWGGTRDAVPDMAELVQGWSNRDRYMGDLDFLNKQVWPRQEVQSSQMSHDAYTCTKYPKAFPFPTRRPADYQHVGQVFFGDGRPRQGDIDDFMLHRQAPKACRGHHGWKTG